MTPRPPGRGRADPRPRSPEPRDPPRGCAREPRRDPAAGRAAAGRRPGSRLARAWPWVPVVVYLGTIFYLSSQPNPLPELTTRLWDKGLHFVEYGTLGALLLLALRSSGAGPGLALLLAVAGASLYGASDELHQAFVPGRSCELLDWVADTLGGALGGSFLALALRLVRAPASIGRRPGRG